MVHFNKNVYAPKTKSEVYRINDFIFEVNIPDHGLSEEDEIILCFVRAKNQDSCKELKNVLETKNYVLQVNYVNQTFDFREYLDASPMAYTINCKFLTIRNLKRYFCKSSKW